MKLDSCKVLAQKEKKGYFKGQPRETYNTTIEILNPYLDPQLFD